MSKRKFDDVQVLLDSPRGSGMVVSCYADTSVAEGFERHWRAHLKAEATRIRARLADSPERLVEFERQLASIRRALVSSEARRAKGMAVFGAVGWDEAMALASDMPYENQLVVDEDPYLVPLLVADYRRREYLVVLTDTHRGRLYAAAPGGAQPIYELVADGSGEGEQPGRAPQDINPESRRDHLRLFRNELVRHVTMAWHAHRYQGIILLGERDPAQELRRALPARLASRVVHEAPCPWAGTSCEIGDRVSKVADAAIADQRRRLLEEIGRRLTEGVSVATGPQEVIEALRDGQVSELVLGPDPGEVASRCPECRSLFAFEEATCPRCKAICIRASLWQEILTLAVRHGVAVHFVLDGAGSAVPGGAAALLARDVPQWAVGAATTEVSHRGA